MTRLSVNINKIATLRNARGGNTPNVLTYAQYIERVGAQGITVHPRPDGRHIRYADVYDLKRHLSIPLTIEGNPQEDKFVDLILNTVPYQVTLVPDGAHALTSDQGWDCVGCQDFLKEMSALFKKIGVSVSVFVAPDPQQIAAAAACGADSIELYTEAYATHYPQSPEQAAQPYVTAATAAQRLGLQVNAGHDLSLENIAYLKQRIPFLSEVSIGHALIGEALYWGLEETIRRYRQYLS